MASAAPHRAPYLNCMPNSHSSFRTAVRFSHSRSQPAICYSQPSVHPSFFLILNAPVPSSPILYVAYDDLQIPFFPVVDFLDLPHPQLTPVLPGFVPCVSPSRRPTSISIRPGILYCISSLLCMLIWLRAQRFCF